MVVGSFKELLNLIILYQMMYITDWSKYSLGCMNNYYFIQNIKITTFFRVKIIGNEMYKYFSYNIRF